MNESLFLRKKNPDDTVVALVGNPNVGKSTLFNALTGLNQHTGNWPGKTVEIAQGRYTYKGCSYVLIDLPGTYSIFSCSEEERIAAEFIQNGHADCTLIVVDATCLERNLCLALQTLQLTNRAIVCVNLMDEAKRRGLELDLAALERELGVPVVGTSADSKEGLGALKEKLRNLKDGFLPLHPVSILSDAEVLLRCVDLEHSDHISAEFSKRAETIAEAVLGQRNKPSVQKTDKIVLGRWTGRILLLTLLLAVFWLTLEGANYPSSLLQIGFDWIYRVLLALTDRWPWWISSFLLDGVFSTCARVISVMLPPMMIFFPLFTFLEDLGYLPRAAFLMDHCFQKCGSCGKQVLTMSMGFGCNAVGVMGCRIITSEKERLLAVITNSLVPCNGRFPALITLCFLFFTQNSFLASGVITAFVLLGVSMTLLSTKIAGNLLFQATKSQFILELPPYRKPNLKKIMIRSLLDRTAFVLSRAVRVAAPAGGILWILQYVRANGQPLLQILAQWLEPVGSLIGLNGAILLAFLLSFPANELLLPMLILILEGGGTSAFQAGTEVIGQVLTAHGWSWKTALCTLVFVLFHWPCGTTCLTIRRETGSWKWVTVSVLMPLMIGITLCWLINLI